MTIKRIFMAVLFIWVAVSSNAAAQMGFDQKSLMRKGAPIEIVSDKMEAFQEKRMIVFSGNAVATQGDIIIKTDNLSVYYKKSNGKKEKIGKQEVEVAGDLDRIELKGHVSISQKDMSATGDEAVYYQESGQFIMTGNPVLQQGKNIIKGCRVVIYANENRGKVEQCPAENSGRVTAIIQPQDKK
ncbi:MAG: lipopolysaccharide transport periplasmic protein LptA [Deltaproteobacteria bacterium]|nr:lipopolysaccharide transport periplasmic protein LptA [Deltaproteobacteria bacterium]